MIDVPLEHAQLTWSDGIDGVAVVIDYRRPADKFAQLGNSRGACDAGWSVLMSDERLLLLMSIAWSAVVRDLVPTAAMHRALLAIPEYRAWISEDAPGLDDWRPGQD